MGAEDLDVEEEGRGAPPGPGSSLDSVAAGMGTMRGPQALTKAEDKPCARSEMVRQVEKLVSTMFKELDALLRAEDINRRVMVRTRSLARSGPGSGEGRKKERGWHHLHPCTHTTHTTPRHTVSLEWSRT